MKCLQLCVASSFLFAAAGCAGMANGVVAIEANAVVLDDYKATDPVPGTDLDDKDVDVKGVGGKVAFNTPILDFTAGYEKRMFDDADADEGSVGLRHRFLDLVGLQPYLELRGLFGQLDADGGDSSSYEGVSLGGGALFNIGDHFFVDANISYEVTSDIDVGTDDTALEGWLARVGIGWSF